ncbi:uncharacterized protein DEA37_0011895 [Paragonimus westermani]|uniref:Uncharacterized protein n=1 Tax=Paragonimus westermani TaxID=34504 RepID=A0A5J4NHP0_9TREM|nr:uncharacterized protein DEA37_0011895 [Paragonimus westermani]
MTWLVFHSLFPLWSLTFYRELIPFVHPAPIDVEKVSATSANITKDKELARLSKEPVNERSTADLANCVNQLKLIDPDEFRKTANSQTHQSTGDIQPVLLASASECQVANSAEKKRKKKKKKKTTNTLEEI